MELMEIKVFLPADLSSEQADMVASQVTQLTEVLASASQNAFTRGAVVSPYAVGAALFFFATVLSRSFKEAGATEIGDMGMTQSTFEMFFGFWQNLIQTHPEITTNPVVQSLACQLAGIKPN